MLRVPVQIASIAPSIGVRISAGVNMILLEPGMIGGSGAAIGEREDMSGDFFLGFCGERSATQMFLLSWIWPLL